MLQVELRVNGCLIHHIDIVNIARLPCKGDVCRYAVESIGQDGVSKCEVTHDRHDGALMLVEEAIDALL